MSWRPRNDKVILINNNTFLKNIKLLRFGIIYCDVFKPLEETHCDMPMSTHGVNRCCIHDWGPVCAAFAAKDHDKLLYHDKLMFSLIFCFQLNPDINICLCVSTGFAVSGGLTDCWVEC